jgi:hypothetical protein
MGAIILGARIFRSRNADPVPPRPWWQLTGRPLSGFVIAGLIMFTGVWSITESVIDPPDTDLPAFIIGWVVTAVISAAYLCSSVLLRRRANA